MACARVIVGDAGQSVGIDGDRQLGAGLRGGIDGGDGAPGAVCVAHRIFEIFRSAVVVGHVETPVRVVGDFGIRGVLAGNGGDWIHGENDDGRSRDRHAVGMSEGGGGGYENVVGSGGQLLRGATDRNVGEVVTRRIE